MTLKNTDKPYIITVVNRQTSDGKVSVIEETAYGSYYERNGKQYVIYKTENEGGAVSSMIKLDGNEAVIKRNGDISSVMTFRAGKEHRFLYTLPYGSVEMSVRTERLLSRLDAEGGTVELLYILTAQGDEYCNDMKITINKR